MNKLKLGGYKMQYNKSRNSSDYVRNIVLIALMAAMVFVATSIIQIRTFNGFIHLGDTMVFVAAVLLGKKRGAAASAIGMTMFDLLSPVPYWAPFTFVIKGVMAYIAGSVALRKDCEGKKVWNNILAFTIAGVWMVAAYYVSGAFVLYLINHEANNLGTAFIMSTYDILGNITQSVAGVLFAIPLVSAALGALKVSRIRL